MLNHFRNLLLNIDGSIQPGFDFLAEEIVPAEYVAVGLPYALATLRAILFGVNPDRAMLNYRLRQFLALLHCTELREYVLALDPRITYDGIRGTDLAGDEPFRPVVSQSGIDVLPAADGSYELKTDAGDPATLQLTPTGAVIDHTGRMSYDCQVLIRSGQITVTDAGSVETSYAITESSGLTDPVEILSVACTARLSTTANITCRIRGYIRPSWDLGQLLPLLEKSGTGAIDAALGTGNEEPYRTFRNWWQDHDELPYRLGAVLLAIGYRTEELRLG